jgi:hypothetical protein
MSETHSPILKVLRKQSEARQSDRRGPPRAPLTADQVQLTDRPRVGDSGAAWSATSRE